MAFIQYKNLFSTGWTEVEKQKAKEAKKKKKKKRNWRVRLLVVSVPLTLFFAMGIGVGFLMNLSTQEYRASKETDATFNFRTELPDGQLRDLARKILALYACHIAAAAANLTYFVFFWPRNDRTYLRSAVTVALSAVAVGFASANLVLCAGVAKAPFDAAEIVRSRRPDLKAEELQEVYVTWLKGYRITTPFVLSVLTAVVQMATVAFWVWFLPARCRLPNRYLPVVQGTKWWLWWWPYSTKGGLLYAQVDFVDINMDTLGTGPLAAVFEAHEQARDTTVNTKSKIFDQALEVKAGGGSKTRNLTNGNQRPKAGPQIDPAVRYWALRRNDSFMITLWTRVLAFWVVLCVSFEIAIYVLIKQHDLKCTWNCHMVMVYPWLFLAWAVTFAYLVWKRVPLDRKVLSALRLDVLLCVAMGVIWLFWLTPNIARWSWLRNPDSDDAEYRQSIWNDTDRNSTYTLVVDISKPDSMVGGMLSAALLLFGGLMIMAEYFHEKRTR